MYTGITIENIRYITEYSQSVLFNMKKWAKERRFNSFVDLIIYDIYVENTFRSRKPDISLYCWSYYQLL